MPRRRRNRSIKRRRSRKDLSLGGPTNATILFVDVIGCSEISNYSSLKRYNEIITMFQKCFYTVCDYYKTKVYGENEQSFNREARGDEGCLKIYVGKTPDSLARDIDVAITIALDLKRLWLLTEYNKDRIDQGLLPIDLAAGIHFGQVYVQGDNAEGYTINLAKRIESHSREGSFSHIIVSESAQGQLHFLKDEQIYKFGQPFTIKAKNIAQAVRVFEIEHHFLPTDFEDTIYYEPEEISMVFQKRDDKNIDVIKSRIKKAYEMNPTNPWLAEVFIYLHAVSAALKLRKNKLQDDYSARRKEYGLVEEIAGRIAKSCLGNAATLSIWGQILGLMGEYSDEEAKYDEAIELDKTDGNFYWYRGLCVSYQMEDAYRKSKRRLKNFYDDDVNQKRIKRIFEDYKKGMDLKPMNPWIVYDYACELSWWSKANDEFREMAVEKLLEVLKLDPELKDWVKGEKYLKPIINDPKIKPWLK